MILAFTLGILAVTHVVTVWEIIVLAFGLGVVNAIDSPARQSYVIELVGEKESLASAIALNSGMFNAARVIGPSIAGLLIAAVGTGMAFILNGVSYIAVIIALYFITTPLTVPHVSGHPIAAIKEGLRYTYHHTVIRTLIILAGVVSIFGWSYSTLMPVIATQTFHFSAAGLGYLYAAAGLGALTATILISAYSHRMNRMTIIASGTILFSTALLLFTFVSNIPVAFILLFAIGIGLVSQFSMINTVIQHEVEDAMRGRVMSVYTLVFIGLSPFGSLGIGLAAEYVGSQWAMRLSASVVLLVGIYLIINRHHLIQNKLPTGASSES
jgi:MFS family permease